MHVDYLGWNYHNQLLYLTAEVYFFCFPVSDNAGSGCGQEINSLKWSVHRETSECMYSCSFDVRIFNNSLCLFELINGWNVYLQNKFIFCYGNIGNSFILKQTSEYIQCTCSLCEYFNNGWCLYNCISLTSLCMYNDWWTIHLFTAVRTHS